MQSSRVLPGLIAALALTLAPLGTWAQGSPQIERGRYMVLTGHCNNCHTAGYAPKEGDVPEKDWLLGSGPLGWRGPWGTTYASNLRLTAPAMTEEQWVQYIRSLGPAGQNAQPHLPPDKEPRQPFNQAPLPPK